MQSPKESLSLPNCQTSGSFTFHTTSFSKRDLRSLKILRNPKLLPWKQFCWKSLQNSFSSFHGSSLGFRKIFCKSSLLRKCTWACKSRWKDALHILRLQVQHTKTNKSCQWTKHWKKNLPKLETMAGRFPFFLVTLHKVILRCSFSAHVSESQPLEDPQPRNLKHPLRKIGMNSLALNSIRAHTVQSVMTYSTIQCSRGRNEPFWILLIFWGDIYHLVLHASIGPKTIQKKLYTVQSTTQLVKIDSRANIFRPHRSFLQKTVASI